MTMDCNYYVNFDEGGKASVPQSETSSQSTLWMGATMPQMLENAEKLASDPEYRKQVEADVRSKLVPGESFWIDEMGIGHFWGALHVSDVGLHPSECRGG